MMLDTHEPIYKHKALNKLKVQAMGHHFQTEPCFQQITNQTLE